MRWMRRGVAAAGLLIGLLVVGVGVAALLFDPASLKPRIEAAVLGATGRVLSIDGPAALRLWPAPALELRQVGLANRPGGSARPMLTLARLRVVLEWPALLRGALVARRLELDQPDILLEADTDGVGNWQMGPAAARPPATAASPVPAAAPLPAPVAPAPPLSLPVRTVVLRGGKLTMHNAVSGRGFGIEMPDLELHVGGGDAAMSLAGDVALGAQQLQVSVRTGSLAALWSMAADWPFQLAVTGEGVDLSVHGSVAQPATGAGIGADVALKLDQTARLAGLLPAGLLPGLHDVALSGHVAADITGDRGAARVEVSSIALTARELAAAGTMGWAGAGAGLVSGTVDVARLDLDGIEMVAGVTVAGAVPVAAPNAAPERVHAPVASSGKTDWLIPDDPWPPGLVSGPGLDVTLSVGTLTRRHEKLGPLRAHVGRADGRLAVAPLSLAMPGGTLAGTLSVNGTATGAPEVAFDLDGQGLAAGPLLVQLGQPALLTGAVDVHARLSGSGGSPHAVAADASGAFGLAVVGGQIETGIATGPLGPLLPQLGSTANQALGRGALRCLALAASLKDGQAHVGTLMLDSAMLFADGGGEVSLRTERLDLRMKPVLRLPPVTGIAIPVRVTGPILHPEVGWDGPVLQGKAAFSAVIGVLPETGGSDGCPRALAAARFGRSGAMPPPAPLGPVGKGLDGLLPGLGRLLDQLR